MFEQNNDLITSYKDLVQILSHRFEFYCEGDVLYGRNLNTSQRFKLARYNDIDATYIAMTGTRGFLLIDMICKRFNNEMLSKNFNKPELKLEIVKFTSQIISNLGNDKSYGSID